MNKIKHNLLSHAVFLVRSAILTAMAMTVITLWEVHNRRFFFQRPFFTTLTISETVQRRKNRMSGK